MRANKTDLEEQAVSQTKSIALVLSYISNWRNQSVFVIFIVQIYHYLVICLLLLLKLLLGDNGERNAQLSQCDQSQGQERRTLSFAHEGKFHKGMLWSPPTTFAYDLSAALYLESALDFGNMSTSSEGRIHIWIKVLRQ